MSGIALAILLNACSSPPRSIAVKVEQFKFVPSSIELRTGDTLVVSNHDLAPHTLTHQEHKWDTGLIAPDSVRRVVVTAAGKFFCAFHPTMTGTVTIR